MTDDYALTTRQRSEGVAIGGSKDRLARCLGSQPEGKLRRKFSVVARQSMRASLVVSRSRFVRCVFLPQTEVYSRHHPSIASSWFARKHCQHRTRIPFVCKYADPQPRLLFVKVVPRRGVRRGDRCVRCHRHQVAGPLVARGAGAIPRRQEQLQTPKGDFDHQRISLTRCHSVSIPAPDSEHSVRTAQWKAHQGVR